jgi:hypothetical protein
VIASEPIRWDWTLLIGDTAQPASFVLEEEDGTPYDLTDVTGECQIRAEAGGLVLLEPAVTITDAVGGTFTFSASAASTAILAPGRARYAVRLTWPDATVRTVVEGTVTIRLSAVS